MILAPGNYTLGGGGSNDEVEAYCIDKFLPQPDQGTSLSFAPAGYGAAFVTVEGESPISLSDAIQKKVLVLEGTDDWTRLSVRNLSDKKIALDIRSPALVAQNDTYGTDDIKTVFPALSSRSSPKKAESTVNGRTSYGNNENRMPNRQQTSGHRTF
jgi:hypothetical protein